VSRRATAGPDVGFALGEPVIVTLVWKAPVCADALHSRLQTASRAAASWRRNSSGSSSSSRTASPTVRSAARTVVASWSSTSNSAQPRFPMGWSRKGRRSS
jgi:hypothetical protein